MKITGKISTAALLLASVMLVGGPLGAMAQPSAGTNTAPAASRTGEFAPNAMKSGSAAFGSLQPAAAFVNIKNIAAVTTNTGVPTRSAATPNNTAATVKTASAADLVPSIIQKLTPSVVGIIGEAAEEEEDESSDESYARSSLESGSYNLAHGTGVIIKADGWIITNAHVVNGILDPTVVTSSGKQYAIDKKYIDVPSDLALIHIKATSLKPAVLAPVARQVQVGEKVVALGTPVSFSLRGSATEGIVSGLNRAVNASYRLIQTDAAINPGNSGGPLLNMKGEVIGINSMKYEAVGVENLGFSIPFDTVRYVINQLFAYGEVHRPSLGVKLQEGWAAEVGLPSDDPLTVVSVDSASARKAGLKAGDQIYRINNTAITSLVDLNEQLKKYKPGQTVSLWMQSGGDIVKRSLVLSLDNNGGSGSVGDE